MVEVAGSEEREACPLVPEALRREVKYSGMDHSPRRPRRPLEHYVLEVVQVVRVARHEGHRLIDG